jgi:ABC-type uncharacterized transport system permease subunit
MGPLPYTEHDQSGCIYVAALGTMLTFVTYIESTHALWRGCVAGAIGGGILCAIWWLVRTRRGFE